MNRQSHPDPGLHRAALDHNDWLDMQWQKAHQPGPDQASPTNSEPSLSPIEEKHRRELNACEMALVILGGILMFGGFLVPISMLAGLACFVLALGFSAYKKG